MYFGEFRTVSALPEPELQPYLRIFCSFQQWDVWRLVKAMFNDIFYLTVVWQKRAIWLLSADVAVDTFFTISGLLLVFTTASKMTPSKS